MVTIGEKYTLTPGGQQYIVLMTPNRMLEGGKVGGTMVVFCSYPSHKNQRVVGIREFENLYTLVS